MAHASVESTYESKVFYGHPKGLFTMYIAAIDMYPFPLLAVLLPLIGIITLEYSSGLSSMFLRALCQYSHTISPLLLTITKVVLFPAMQFLVGSGDHKRSPRWNYNLLPSYPLWPLCCQS